MPSDELCKLVAERQNGVCLLRFSRGKDAIATWIQVRRFFKRVIPYYTADVPGLKFVEDSLRHFEEHFETPIIRFVSPKFFEAVDAHTYRPPWQRHAAADADLFRELTNEQIDDFVRESNGLPPETLIAVGQRASDSFTRRMTMVNTGVLREDRRWFYAIHDWSHQRVYDEILAEGCGLPVDYELFGRSFESTTQHRYLAPLKESYPDDYERILRWFPLARLDGYRREIT